MSQLSQPLSVGYVAPNTDVTANKLNKNNEEDQASVYPHSPQVSILIKLLSEIREMLTLFSGLVKHIYLVMEYSIAVSNSHIFVFLPGLLSLSWGKRL